MIHVRNIHDPSVGDATLCYVGRTYKPVPGMLDFSVLGNPFVIGKDGTRDEVIAGYSAWLSRKLAEKDPAIRTAMNQLYKLASEQHIVLLCHCYPEPCHADILQKRLLGFLPPSPNMEETIERELVLQGYRRLKDGSIEWLVPMYKPVGSKEYVRNPAIKLLRDPYILDDTSINGLKRRLGIIL